MGQGTVGAACVALPLLLPPLPLLEPPDFGWRLLRLPERLVLEVAPPDPPPGPLPPLELPERYCGAGQRAGQWLRRGGRWRDPDQRRPR